ncbi:snare associated Golgi protein-domain-containing protein [Pavlovales sp. CCMP2436]|nr:snare associated Golgi protein-domain-containing protein [Pavlovales sp. CCMP2436]
MSVGPSARAHTEELAKTEDVELSDGRNAEPIHDAGERLMAARDARPRGVRAALRALARHSVKLRLATLGCFTLALVLLSRHPALRDLLTLSALRARLLTLTAEHPALSLLAYVAIFCSGELMHIPGVVFIVLGVVCFGRWAGFVAAYLGSVTSVVFSFIIVRAVGGQPLSEDALNTAWGRRLSYFLQRLHSEPILIVALTRLLFWIAPPLNYMLAMSQVSLRDYTLGSMLGLVPPIFVLCSASSVLLPWLETRGTETPDAGR